MPGHLYFRFQMERTDGDTHKCKYDWAATGGTMQKDHWLGSIFDQSRNKDNLGTTVPIRLKWLNIQHISWNTSASNAASGELGKVKIQLFVVQ